MTISYIGGVLFAFLLLVVSIPILAWNGRPKAFNRLNWIGISVGAAIMAILLLPFPSHLNPALPPYELLKYPEWKEGGDLMKRYDDLKLAAMTFGVFGVLFGAIAIGSLVSIFMHRPRQ